MGSRSGTIISINSGASTVTLNAPLANAHPANEWAGTEFVQYRWYPDVELDNVFFHDHVNGIFGWSYGMVGQLVIEPVGSTYHDPVTGEEIRSGAIADIHTSNPLIPGVIDGSFREFVLWTINDHNPVEATLNLRAEPWADRSLDPRLRFSSNSPQGDPFTPIFRAYARTRWSSVISMLVRHQMYCTLTGIAHIGSRALPTRSECRPVQLMRSIHLYLKNIL